MTSAAQKIPPTSHRVFGVVAGSLAFGLCRNCLHHMRLPFSPTAVCNHLSFTLRFDRVGSYGSSAYYICWRVDPLITTGIRLKVQRIRQENTMLWIAMWNPA